MESRDNKREETDAIRSKEHACNGHWKISLCRRNGNGRIDKRMRETFELKINKRRKDIGEEYAKNERSFISSGIKFFISNDIKNYTRAGMSFNLALQMCEILARCVISGERQEYE